jgi:hypothetical protein
MIDIECVATQAGGGDVTPAASVATTSLEVRTTVADPAVVEPPKPAEALAEAGSDEISLDEIFNIELGLDDDSDAAAYPRSRRIICSTSSDGQTTIHRFGSTGIALTAEETREVYEFLANSARIWGGAML